MYLVSGSISRLLHRAAGRSAAASAATHHVSVERTFYRRLTLLRANSSSTAGPPKILRPRRGTYIYGYTPLAAAAFLSAALTGVVITNLEGIEENVEEKEEDETTRGQCDADISNFVHWLQSACGVSISMQLTNTDETNTSNISFTNEKGKGTAVVLNVPPTSGGDDKQIIATVPRRSIIDTDTLQDEDGQAPAYFRDWLRNKLADEKEGAFLTERRVLMLYYLCEGHSSPYLRTFPRLPSRGEDDASLSANTPAPIPPLFWTNEDREKLSNTEIIKPLEAKERALRKEWNDHMSRWLKDLMRHAAAYNDNVSTSSLAYEKDFGDFCWADSLFWTRILEYSTDDSSATYHWVPLVDACNHSYTPNCYWSEEKEGNIDLITKTVDGDTTESKANAPVELCYMYGEKPNSELLFSHGFCVDDNPYESITWSLLDKDHILSNDKARLIRTLQLRPRITMNRQRQQFDFEEDALGHFDLESIYILFLLVLDEHELVACEGDGTARDSAFVCRIRGAKGSAMKIQNYDDFEDFCDDQCDILMPRVRVFLTRLIDERQHTILKDSWYHSATGSEIRRDHTPRDRLIHQLLSGQLRLLSEVATLVSSGPQS